MEYLKVWTSFRELLEPLTDAERGRLFVAMLEYAESGAEPQLSGSERYVWPAARQSIDRTRQDSMNAKKGGSRSKPTATEANRTEPKPTEANYKDKEKDKDKDNNKSAKALSARARDFDKFWAIYPRREGKQAAQRAFEKLKPDEALLTAMINAITKQKQSPQWAEPRFIPHPATWLNGHRWEDEPAKDAGKRVSAQQYEQREYHESEMRELLGTDDLFK